MNELIKKIHEAGVVPSPKWDGVDIFILAGHIDFEQYSYETWDTGYYLELPWCQFYWRSTEGWEPGKAGLTMKFRGKTVEEVVRHAVEFLTIVPKPLTVAVKSIDRRRP